MVQTKTEANWGARTLPILALNGRDYFVDLRLRELRAVQDPLMRIDLRSAEGRAAVAAWKAIYCRACGQPTVVRRNDPAEVIECRRCGQAAVVQGAEPL